MTRSRRTKAKSATNITFTVTKSLKLARSFAQGDESRAQQAFGREFPRLQYCCARPVHESNIFSTLGLALSEKQIPQIVENIRNRDKEWNYWRGLRCFASRGSPVRSRSRPPTIRTTFSRKSELNLGPARLEPNHEKGPPIFGEPCTVPSKYRNVSYSWLELINHVELQTLQHRFWRGAETEI